MTSSGTLRIEMFDGTLDEIEKDTWRSLSAEPVEPPEDWTGPLDNVEGDDLEEFASESDAQPQEYFRDDREPWESLLDEEPMRMGAQQLQSEGEPDEPQRSRRPPSQRAVPLRASG